MSTQSVAASQDAISQQLLGPIRSIGIIGAGTMGQGIAQVMQRLDDAVERLPVSRRAADAAVDDEVLGPLRDPRVEVVEEHPQRGLWHTRPRAR